MSVSALERHYRPANEATAARRYQAIWFAGEGLENLAEIEAVVAAVP